ncbi:MAG: hypothetical protein ACFFG0_20240 [Candidatus Thorarchaeota archaeon]
MTTTIQIDDETKKKLFKIKLRLEEQKGSAMTYNEIIEYLIENQPLNTIRKTSLQEFQSLKGILSESAKEIYLEEKRKDLKREESIAPLKSNQK